MSICLILPYFRLALNHPAMDKHILGSLKRLFLQRNKKILCSKSPDAYNNCSNAQNVHEFIKSHYTFAGFSTLREYYSANNPIDWLPKVGIILGPERRYLSNILCHQMKTPLLLINSEDDIVCLAENIREDIIRSVELKIGLKYCIKQSL